MRDSLSDDDRCRLEDLFARATGLPAADQPAFVIRECGANLQLCAALLRLLAAHAGEDHLQRLRSRGLDRRGGGSPANRQSADDPDPGSETSA